MNQILAQYSRLLTSSPSFLSRQISTTGVLRNVGAAGGTGSTNSVPKGKIFAKEPVKIKCDQGHSYKWCSCGMSKKQPFCDGRPLCQPVNFKARESKEYVFCNCKQTNKQPFCDGSHKNL